MAATHVIFHLGWIRTFVESLEEGHFGDGVALGRREFTRVAGLPGAESIQADEDGGIVPGLAVGGDAEDELDAVVAGRTVVAVALIIILIDISGLGGISLHAPDGGNSGQRC